MSPEFEKALRDELGRYGMNPRKVKWLRHQLVVRLKEYETAVRTELKETT